MERLVIYFVTESGSYLCFSFRVFVGKRVLVPKLKPTLGYTPSWCVRCPRGKQEALPWVMTIPASALWRACADARPMASSWNFCVTSWDTVSANSCKTQAASLCDGCAAAMSSKLRPHGRLRSPCPAAPCHPGTVTPPRPRDIKSAASILRLSPRRGPWAQAPGPMQNLRVGGPSPTSLPALQRLPAGGLHTHIEQSVPTFFSMSQNQF